MVTMSSNQHRGAVKAFTLIELLVVISIIALLISILLPAMREAKRRAKVLTCMAQLKSLGVGMAAYVAENDGNYPTPSCINGNWVASQYTPIDNTQILVDMGGGIPEMYWCPLNAYRRPSDFPEWNNPEFPMGKHFEDVKPGHYYPSVGMMIPFIIIDTKVHGNQFSPGGGIAWDWSHSGNPDGPWFPGDSSAIAITETGGTGVIAPVAPDWKTNLKCSTHTACIGKFREVDSLWGDGHVKSRSRPENYIYRLGPPAVGVY